MTDTPGGRDIAALHLDCDGIGAELLTIGATLRRLESPDRHGVRANLVLGYRDLADYARHPLYLGATIGRYANRIAGGRFAIDGTEYRLPVNDPPNNLHGGPDGFDIAPWEVVARDRHTATLRLTSPDGDQGFPGTMTAQVRYDLEADGMMIALSATTDAPTVVNLTNHAYYNLAGEASGADILDHWLQIPASCYTPVNPELIPLGPMQDVTGTPFDFRRPKPVGRDIDAHDSQIALGQGYDHNFGIDDWDGGLRRMATLHHPGSGRTLDLYSTEPGLQFYSGNHLGDAPPGTSGTRYARRSGLCLEPQRFPDTPNRADYPPARLDPGETYRHVIAIRLRVADSLATAFAL